MEWIGLIWLRIGTSGRLLWTRYWTFGFHKMLGSSWVAAQLAAPQEGLSSVSKLSVCSAYFHTKRIVQILIMLLSRITQAKICVLSKLTVPRMVAMCIQTSSVHCGLQFFFSWTQSPAFRFNALLIWIFHLEQETSLLPSSDIILA
jgi:hypothetical protein